MIPKRLDKWFTDNFDANSFWRRWAVALGIAVYVLVALTVFMTLVGGLLLLMVQFGAYAGIPIFLGLMLVFTAAMAK